MNEKLDLMIDLPKFINLIFFETKYRKSFINILYKSCIKILNSAYSCKVLGEIEINLEFTLFQT